MNAEARKKLEDEEKALLDLFVTSKIERDTYAKKLIGLGFQYAAAGDAARAQPLLCKVHQEYYGEVLGKQMVEDEAFRAEAFGLAEKLVEAGVISLEREYSFWKPPAEA